ncbi:hypothetical protein RHGRI_000871 [Rhododendron griersonianum]|uniref:Uncharacterized protein n=1 Tax=Rhododendron griersonianum TaxID=479676 RepID=A0AAV6LIJ5_9ERIC|nr:hypothetical protein RHGRI_000871 [Rhododendron griersonianum]
MPPRRQQNVQDLTLRDQIAEFCQSNQALQQMMNELLQRIPVSRQSTDQSEGSGRTIFDNEEDDVHSTSSSSVAEPAFINPWSMDQLARVLESSDRSIQVHVPDFEGKLNADEYCDWTAALEAFFNWKDLSNERKTHKRNTKSIMLCLNLLFVKQVLLGVGIYREKGMRMLGEFITRRVLW